MTNRNPERGRESRATRDYGSDPGNERYEARAWRERDDTMPLGSRESIRDSEYGRRDENEESPYRSSGRGYESGMQSQYGGMQGPQGGMQSQYGNPMPSPYAGAGRYDEWRDPMQGPRGEDVRRYGSGRGFAEGIQPQQSYGYGSNYGNPGHWSQSQANYGSPGHWSPAQDRSAMTGQSYGSSYPGQTGYGGGSAYGQQYGGGQSYAQQGYTPYGQSPYAQQPQAAGAYQQGAHMNYGQGYFSRPYEQSSEYAGFGGYGTGSASSYGTYAQTGRNYGQPYQGAQAQTQYGQAYPGGAQYGSQTQYGSQYGQSASRAGTESHRGQGPKGYTRSDDRIREDICERLTDDPYIDASDINITARDGTVTLEGRVDERWMKHRVEDLIDACPGVKQIENRLTVAGQSESDTDTTTGKGSASTTGASQSTGAAKRH